MAAIVQMYCGGVCYVKLYRLRDRLDRYGCLIALGEQMRNYRRHRCYDRGDLYDLVLVVSGEIGVQLRHVVLWGHSVLSAPHAVTGGSTSHRRVTFHNKPGVPRLQIWLRLVWGFGTWFSCNLRIAVDGCNSHLRCNPTVLWLQLLLTIAPWVLVAYVHNRMALLAVWTGSTYMLVLLWQLCRYVVI